MPKKYWPSMLPLRWASSVISQTADANARNFGAFFDSVCCSSPRVEPGVSLGGDLIQLHAAFGQDEANYGAARYSVDNEGLIQVPLEAVGPLTTIGGFLLVTTGDNAISAGALALHHDDAAGCSYAGRQYLGDSNGDVLVPAEAASELLAHGF